jgi:hypothetical protein
MRHMLILMADSQGCSGYAMHVCVTRNLTCLSVFHNVPLQTAAQLHQLDDMSFHEAERAVFKQSLKRQASHFLFI